jgi:hypothetical protein
LPGGTAEGVSAGFEPGLEQNQGKSQRTDKKRDRPVIESNSSGPINARDQPEQKEYKQQRSSEAEAQYTCKYCHQNEQRADQDAQIHRLKEQWFLLSYGVTTLGITGFRHA